MDAVQMIRRLHQHRAWVNRNVVDAAAGLSNEQLRQAFPIGQGSIWKSFLHLYAAEHVWLEALLGHENPCLPGDVPGQLPGNQLGVGGVTGFDDLRQKWESQERLWATYLATLSPAALDETVYKTSTSSGLGKRFGTHRSDILLHVCTHAHYTIAQVMNMLRQAGVEKLPDTMLISLARLEVAGNRTEGTD